MSSACQILVHFLNFQLQKIRRISSTMSLELTLKFCNKATKLWLFVIHLSGFCHPISTFSTKPKVSSFQGVAKAFYSSRLFKLLDITKKIEEEIPKGLTNLIFLHNKVPIEPLWRLSFLHRSKGNTWPRKNKIENTFQI